jgi:omega-hydroxy-beta-dihydromenaquinone-9 sulfotransferase
MKISQTFRLPKNRHNQPFFNDTMKNVAYYSVVLFRHHLSLIMETTRRCRSTFGFGRFLMNALIGRPLLIFLNQFFLLLDIAFFPGYRKIKLIKPIFITGHPRSGTTFFHRMLSQTDEFANYEFWQTVFPSLIARKLLAPIDRFIKRKSSDAVFVKNSGHFISWSSIEEEEFLFLGCYNSPWAMLFTGLAFGEEDFWELFYFDNQPSGLRKAIMTYFKGCLKRQSYYLKKKQILSKIPYAMLRAESLIETFPDAKFVYLIRSPYEVIPSYLSLIRAILDDLWGLKNLSDPLLKTIYQRLYAQSIRYYQWIDVLENKKALFPDHFLTIPYNQLRDNLPGVLDRFLDFTDVQISEELRNQILKQSKKQKSYQRQHQNLSLEDFGFTKEDILHDLEFVFDMYGFEK